MICYISATAGVCETKIVAENVVLLVFLRLSSDFCMSGWVVEDIDNSIKQ